MCAEGVDAVEQSGSGMLRSPSGRTQGSYPSGLGSRDEEISAMLQNGHANITQQAALMGVMNFPASSNNPDLLNSFRMPHSTYQGGYNNNNTIPADFPSRQPTIRAPQAGGAATMLAQHRWATNYNNGVQQQDDKSSHWGHVEPVKSETLEMSPNQAFDASGVYESPVTSFTGMLQRYHSAPSSFLQSLSELNEDGGAGGGNGFSQVSNNAMGSLFPPDRRLTPITEQMDVERMAGNGGLSMHDFEHFLGASDEGEFGPPRSTTLSALGKKESDTGNAFSASKETSVLRQKRPPAVSLELINKATKDRLDTNASAEESSSATSEENSLDAGLKAMYAQDEYFRDSLTSWKSPTSPAGGKRLRGLAGDSDTSSGSAEAPPFPYRNSQFGSLRRHMSLPSPMDGPSSLSVEDQAAFGTVQMRARAKRGCATHPRSIAERVRRTRISERMKKLQDLVPNMDKQTNTADMLDETVEYVKSLQLQVEELNETVAKLRTAQQ